MANKIPEGRSKRGSLRNNSTGGLAASKGSVKKTTSGSDLVDIGIDKGLDNVANTVSKAGIKGKVAATVLKNDAVRNVVKNTVGEKLNDAGLTGKGATSSSADLVSNKKDALARAETAGTYVEQSLNGRLSPQEETRPDLSVVQDTEPAHDKYPAHAKTPAHAKSQTSSRGSLKSPLGLRGKKKPSLGKHAAKVALKTPVRVALLPIVLPLVVLGLLLLVVLGLVLGFTIGGDTQMLEESRQFIPTVNIAQCEKAKVDGKEKSAVGSGTWSGEALSPSAGRIHNGPAGGDETFYDLPMDGVIDLCIGENIKINGKVVSHDDYHVREDGAKMLGDYVMVAANLDIHPRGTIVPSSLGPAIVVDTGSFADDNPKQLDIATTWGNGSSAPADFDSKYKGKYAVSNVSSSGSKASASSISQNSSTDFSDTIIIGDSITDGWCTGQKIDELMPGITRDSVSSRTIHDDRAYGAPDEGVLYFVEQHSKEDYKRFVIETGNNEGSGNGLTLEDGEKIVSMLGNSRDIYFVTIYVKTSHGEANTRATNETIDKLVESHSNVHKIDWYSLVKDHVAEYLGSDVCHPNSEEGKQAYAELVKEGLGGASGASLSKDSEEDPCKNEKSSTPNTPFDGEWCLYNQGDATTWGGQNSLPEGCGCVCLSMIFTTYSKDKAYTPDKLIADGLCDGNGWLQFASTDGINGYCEKNPDIGLTALHGTASKDDNGWKDNWDMVVETCKKGGCVMIGQNGLGATAGSHYVVVTKIENGTCYVANPAGGVMQEVPESDFTDPGGLGYSGNTTQCVYFTPKGK